MENQAVVAKGRVDYEQKIGAVVLPRCAYCHAPNPKGLAWCKQCDNPTPPPLDLGTVSYSNTNFKKHWQGQFDIWRRLLKRNRDMGRSWPNIISRFLRGDLSWN